MTFAKMQFLSMTTFLFSDGYRLMLQHFHISGQPLPNITLLVFHAKFGEIFNYFKSSGIFAIAFVVGLIFWGLTGLLAFISLFLIWRSEKKVKFAVISGILLILYFAILTGPVAQARYRVPVTPFLFPLAIYSLFKLKSFIENKKTT